MRIHIVSKHCSEMLIKLVLHLITDKCHLIASLVLAISNWQQRHSLNPFA
jgi:hypothetical protein